MLAVHSRIRMCVCIVFYTAEEKKISHYNLEKNLDIRLLTISAILHSNHSSEET